MIKYSDNVGKIKSDLHNKKKEAEINSYSDKLHKLMVEYNTTDISNIPKSEIDKLKQ